MANSALSRSDERLIHALHRRKAREAQGFFLAEGIRVVEELVASGLTIKLAVVSSELEDNSRGRALIAKLSQRTDVSVVPDHVLRAAAATENPQGVLAVAHEPESNLDALTQATASRVLVCDAVQDPGNLGTLIRVADAFALDAVVLLPGTVDPWNPKVVRSAAGSSFRMPQIPAAIAELKEWFNKHEYRALGADTTGDPLDVDALPPRVALVVGNEGAGLRADTRTLLDALVRIPMPGPAESLNVAVAAGILLYALTRGSK
ncbi:MAG: RNA methyltransferase [Gemmatimonadota bacterium]